MSALVFNESALRTTAFIEVSFLRNSLMSMASEIYDISPRGGTLQLGKPSYRDRHFPFGLKLLPFRSRTLLSCKVFAY